MLHLNEGFTCENCHTANPKAEKTCRNHCIQCLFSKHVDLETTGDRKSTCKGLMEPIKIDSNGKKGFQILHRCKVCGKEMLNKTASDDNLVQIIKIIQRQNQNPDF